MEIDIRTLLILIIAAASIYSALRAHAELAKRVSDLDQRIAKMEQASRLRMPYRAFEEILNGMAALEVRDREVELEKNILENARAHFSNALKVGTKREEE
jgi:hypothetical protein